MSIRAILRRIRPVTVSSHRWSGSSVTTPWFRLGKFNGNQRGFNDFREDNHVSGSTRKKPVEASGNQAFSTTAEAIKGKKLQGRAKICNAWAKGMGPALRSVVSWSRDYWAKKLLDRKNDTLTMLQRLRRLMNIQLRMGIDISTKHSLGKPVRHGLGKPVRHGLGKMSAASAWKRRTFHSSAFRQALIRHAGAKDAGVTFANVIEFGSDQITFQFAMDIYRMVSIRRAEGKPYGLLDPELILIEDNLPVLPPSSDTGLCSEAYMKIFL